MTQDTHAGAGGQPAPALQSEALRIAMHLRQRAQLSRPGNLDSLSASGANELERQHAELSAAQSEAKHWRSNHDNVVARLRIFTQRPDIPKELADRLPWYRELVRLQAVEAQALQQSAEITDAEIDRIAESMPGGLDGFLKAWGWRQFARAILQAAPPAPAAVAVPDEQYQAQMAAISTAAIGYWKEGDAIHPDYDTVALRDVAKLYVKYSLLFNALAAAPAQAWPSECDSPELCQVHRGCAGQYGTKNTCPSIAALNPCNTAAPAQAVAVPADALESVRVLLRVAKNQSSKASMAHAIGVVQAEVKKAAARITAAPAHEHATQLAGQDGEQSEGLAQAIDERDTAEGWADGLAGLIGAYFGQDIGEHSSAHNPWQEAKDIIEEAEPYRPAAAAPAQAQEDAPIVWPKSRDVGRIGDMSMTASLRVGLDGDNDTYVNVWDENGGGSIEFCTPGAGGGKSSRTRVALLALMVAMEADNAEDPRRDWWAASAAQGGDKP